MNPHANKLIDLHEAVARYVPDGAHISIGGFTINRNPMAAVYEIIRQRKKHLHVYAHSNGQGVDELIGAGCVDRIEIAYCGTGRFAPTCIRFKKAVQSGLIMVEDYSNYQMTLRFLAGAMGVPFLPTRSGLGTDILEKWGFPRELRQSSPGLPDQKLVVMDNPFVSWLGIEKVVLVPAICPDVTLIHVQAATPQGVCRIDGLTFADIEQAKAARHVIVTCETLVQPEVLKADPDRNQIPAFCVAAVVHQPHGAYPTACFRHYDYDPEYLNSYSRKAQDDHAYQTYLDTFIYRTENHSDLLAKVGSQRMAVIQADPRTGYAVDLDRR
jgi:glutaconate CoA-transferase, subunit A